MQRDAKPQTRRKNSPVNEHHARRCRARHCGAQRAANEQQPVGRSRISHLNALNIFNAPHKAALTISRMPAALKFSSTSPPSSSAIFAFRSPFCFRLLADIKALLFYMRRSTANTSKSFLQERKAAVVKIKLQVQRLKCECKNTSAFESWPYASKCKFHDENNEKIQTAKLCDSDFSRIFVGGKNAI